MNRETFARSMLILAEIYGEPVSDLRLEGYLDALNDLPEHDVINAMRASPRTCKFFPRPADIREIAAQLGAERRRHAEIEGRRAETKRLEEAPARATPEQMAEFWRTVREVAARKCLPSPGDEKAQ